MSETMSREQITRSYLSKTVDNYYVQFLGIENNAANLLGRQVISFERPVMTFNTFITRIKEEQIPNSSQITFQPNNIVFRDDDSNLTMKIIVEQLYRQNGQVGPMRKNNTFENAKFDIMVQVFNSANNPIETFTMKRCFIMNLSSSQYIYQNATDNQLTCQIQCATIDYAFVQDYIDGSFGSSQTNELP